MSEMLRPRPRVLPSSTTVLATSHGDLYLTVALDGDGDGDPFEVFGRMGKSGTFEQGVTELACRLISLHLRRGTPIMDIVDQCRGVGGMEPRLNKLPGGRPVFVQGLGDGIAHILQGFVKEDVQAMEKTQPVSVVRPSVAERDAEFVRVA